MRVWAVSLLSHQLSPAGLTPPLNFAVFGVSLNAIPYGTAPIECSTPAKIFTEGYTNIYFGENQLSPGSLGILPLTTAHPMLLYQQRVRTSSRRLRRIHPGHG